MNEEIWCEKKALGQKLFSMGARAPEAIMLVMNFFHKLNYRCHFLLAWQPHLMKAGRNFITCSRYFNPANKSARPLAQVLIARDEKLPPLGQFLD